MIGPNRIVPLASLLLVSATMGPANAQNVRHLALTAIVGKAVFFEDEPILVLVRLANVGSDTAWVLGFGAVSADVEMSVRRNGDEVPVGGVSVNYICPRQRDRCGEPLAPGKSHLSAGILQVRAGDERDAKRSLFVHHLGPGDYELRVSAYGVVAAPVTFRVRERSAAETSDLKELEAIRSMMWDRTKPPYEGALISWVARHPQDDPFLPYLLAEWLYAPSTIEVLAREANLDLDSLRVVVLRADKSSPAGAYIAQSMEGWRPEQLAGLMEPLGKSLAGEMARYLVQQRQGKQH